MRLLIVAVGKLKRGPERELEARYVERCKAFGRGVGLSGPEVVELAEGKPREAEARRAAEAADIRAAVGDATMIALDEAGEVIDSARFAARLRRRGEAGERRLAFVIGGADGLDPSLRREAAETIAFGRITLPHQLARIILVEQIYRAMTIMAGHPYHRGG